MKTIHVNVNKGYDIMIGRGLLEQAGTLVRSVSRAAKAAILTDSNVGLFYAAQVRASLETEGFQVCVYTFPAGEASKNLQTIYQMQCFLADAGLTRGDLIVALGGGVTGDMAGFSAAIYLRGIAFVQIPTTLLAQIDSSVGGKTGVDLPAGKNLCGSFWQPELVIIDPDVLATLPAAYFNDGMGEAIKYGCIKSESLFRRLKEENAVDFLDDMIYECVDIKRCIVERDEKESGERMLLNFGHTLGHAIEKYYDFKGLSHGEAVGVGMVMIARAGEKNGLTESGTADKIISLLEKYQLPVSDPAPLDDVLSAAGADKKRSSDGFHLILLHRIGESIIYPVKNQDFRAFFDGGSRP